MKIVKISWRDKAGDQAPNLRGWDRVKYLVRRLIYDERKSYFMKKAIVRPEDVETQVFDWGTIKWLSCPAVTDAKKFTFGVVIVEPGKAMTSTAILTLRR